ncbi:hypothetical protein V6N13_121477 [Hibiscus sabdariffa]|uniref:Uncharacterized protein n=2 Tax=Hibiscus sabdariffa TaxID=183260 RepID=A0ABR2PDM7_9ROSI
MSFSSKIFFSLRRNKQTGFPASSSKFTQQTVRDCSFNMRIRKRKLHQAPEDNPTKKQKGKEILVAVDRSYIFNAAIKKFLPGETSTKSRFCGICMDRKPSSTMFEVTQCGHYFCPDCVRCYMATKLKDENMIEVHCPEPNCGSLIAPQECRSILPLEVIHRWDNALLCSVILPPVLVYECPSDVGEEISERPGWRSKFCGECRDFEHEGMGCEEFKEFMRFVIEDEESDPLKGP